MSVTDGVQRAVQGKDSDSYAFPRHGHRLAVTETIKQFNTSVLTLRYRTSVESKWR
jgi:hypothetical protein